MPQKDLTSTNENAFARRRNMFAAFARTESKETNNVRKEKHFYGPRNRDASAIVHRRAAQGQNSSFDPNVAFQSAKTINDVRQAVHRVRSGGAVVPAKKTHHYNGAPVFY